MNQLTLQQAAKRVGKSEKTLRRYVKPSKDGAPPRLASTTDPSGRYLIEEQDLLHVFSQPGDPVLRGIRQQRGEGVGATTRVQREPGSQATIAGGVPPDPQGDPSVTSAAIRRRLQPDLPSPAELLARIEAACARRSFRRMRATGS